MNRFLLSIGIAAMLWCVAGCLKVDVPSYGGSWGQPEPSAVITPANPNSKADLVRENTQLRERLTWVGNDNRKLSNKYNDLAEDIRKADAKRDQYAAERDAYKGGGR